MTTGRNDPCPCQSGKKYKQCCLGQPAATPPPAPEASHLVQQAAAQLHAGRLAQAEALIQQALRPAPNNADVLNVAGVIAQKQGQLPLALERFSRAIQHAAQPSGLIYFNRGLTQQLLGHLSESAQDYRQAIRLMPDFAVAHSNLGWVSKCLGQPPEAIASCQQALRLQPGLVFAHTTLGLSQHELGQTEAAVASYRRALQLAPDQPQTLLMLGLALESLGQLQEAEAVNRRAIALSPHGHSYANNLGNVLRAQGRLDEAVALYRQALACNPDQDSTHTCLLLTLQYMGKVSPSDFFAEHLAYARQFEAPHKPHWQPHPNPRDPRKRLRIGYVSADFCNHSVAYFIEPVLARHDPAQVEVTCYSNSHHSDAVTARIRAHAHHWRPCAAHSHDELARQIRADGIDILVDLSGHTAGNRLLTFARKPAPVQVTWLGYLGTTGLSAIDYRLTDAYLDPQGQADALYSERLIRLPYCMTFRADPGSPPVNPLPALTSGQLTLSCLNNLAKVNPQLIQLWARILHALPGARLMLGNVTEAPVQARLHSQFAEAGIGPERLILQPRLSLPDYLALHHRIDLALDPHPFCGGVTTNHALWMGVPVVTLSGATTASRQGAALLRAAGLSEFITHSPDDYVARVVQLAGDLPGLEAIRQSLRTRFGSAAGAGAEELTRGVEAAYRQMWGEYCGRGVA